MSDILPIVERLNSDFTSALKSGDKIRLETIRSLRAALKEKEIALRSEKRTLTSDDVTAVLISAAKKRKEAIHEYEKASRTDRADAEKHELEIIQQYLPAQMNPGEIEMELKTLISQLGASGLKDMGKVMSMAMQKFRGRADGKEVQTMVKQLLTPQ
jgi:uncharacterized protein